MRTSLPILPVHDLSFFNCCVIREPEQAMLDHLDKIITELTQEIEQGIVIIGAPNKEAEEAVKVDAEKILILLKSLQKRIDNLLGQHTNDKSIRILNNAAMNYFRLVREMYIVMQHYQTAVAVLEDVELHQQEGIIPLLAKAEAKFRSQQVENIETPDEDSRTILRDTADTIAMLAPQIENAECVENQFCRTLDAFMKIDKHDGVDSPGIKRLEAVRQAVNVTFAQFEGLSNTLATPYMKALKKAICAYEREDYIPVHAKFLEIQKIRNIILQQIIIFSGRELPATPEEDAEHSDSCPSSDSEASSDDSDTDARSSISTISNSSSSTASSNHRLFRVSKEQKRPRSDSDEDNDEDILLPKKQNRC